VEILPGVHRVVVPGSSVFLIEGPPLTLIDAGPRGSGGWIARYLRRLGRSPREVERLILTHYHPDHAGGAAELLQASGARLTAHREEARYLRGDAEMPNPIRHQTLAAAARPLLPFLLQLPLRVDDVLDEGDELPLLGGLRAVHAPGHTPGSLCLYAPRHGALFVGDALQWKRNLLRPPSRHFSEDLFQAMHSIRKLARLDVGTICFSHYPSCSDGGRRLRALAAS
jgi:glyoxylase-like metal-dependent hydrolase (beta-lactamase superfamily II)